MKYIKSILLVLLACNFSGCVAYKYSTWPNGQQIQLGSYYEDRHLQIAWRCSKNGKEIVALNKEYERLHSNTNKVK